MQRFYFNTGLGLNLTITDNDFFKQISVVLRSKIWDEVILFNWDWFEYFYSIEEISKNWVKLKFISKIQNASDPKIEIYLYQAMPNKYSKIEQILQKWVEVWIKKFIFFHSERTKKLSIWWNKIERFNSIIKEALEQCHGNRFPELQFEDSLDLEGISWNNLVCHTSWIKDWELKDVCKDWIYNIFVWPEWWWSENEINNFWENKFNFINFWNRILRTETTGSHLAFLIFYKWCK